MLLSKLIVLQILNILTIKAIRNKNAMGAGNYRAVSAGEFHLNSERPLWILQDKKDEQMKSGRIESLNHRSYNKQQQQQQEQLLTASKRNSKTKAEKRFGKSGVKVPHNYIPLKRARRLNSATVTSRYENSKFIGNMPVFDAIPGDESLTKAFTRPIFIYTGNKGRMLFNTVLTGQKYPMQEPVPGQVLYPPHSLVFKPKNLVENLQQKFNVSMIPFYAHEALDPENENHLLKSASSARTPVQNAKRAKQYAVFFSPGEVHSQTPTDFSSHHYHIEITTNSPPTLEKAYSNHRFHTDPVAFATTTPLPHKKFEVTYNHGDDKFRITYEDEAAILERPATVLTTKSPLPFESYTFDKNYYAFPVYTMAKLMETDVSTQRQDGTGSTAKVVNAERLKTDTPTKERNNSLLPKLNEDTWFILNTRYKGPLKRNANNLHSSKYIQTSALKVREDSSKSVPPSYSDNIDRI